MVGWQSSKLQFAIGMTAYVVFVIAGSLIIDATHPPSWARVLAVLAPVLAAVFAIGSQVRRVRRREGLERTILYEAASLAFFVTVLSALAYGFLQAWADAPQTLSAFWIYGFGMVVWAVLSVLLARGYR